MFPLLYEIIVIKSTFACVKTCSIFILGQYATLTKEIILGQDNLYSEVREGVFSQMHPLTKSDSPDILNCFEHREFFMHWNKDGFHVQGMA